MSSGGYPGTFEVGKRIDGLEDAANVDGVKVFHNLAFYPSLESLSNYFLNTDAGIRLNLTEKMFAEFKIEFKYDSTPAPDASRSDLRYIVGVGWTF